MKENINSNYDAQVDIGKKLFISYDSEMLIKKFGMTADDKYIFLDYLNIPHRINRNDGTVEENNSGKWQECRRYNTVMTIYDLLCYSKGEAPPVLSGKWCSVNKFSIVGSPESGFFTKKYSALFDNKRDLLKKGCESIGGKVQPPMAGADLTYLIPITSFFSVILQFWDSDDEFPAQLKLLWDENSMDFLHFETTFFLQGDILERLAAFMQC